MTAAQVCTLAVVLLAQQNSSDVPGYSWLKVTPKPENCLARRFDPPAGFQRLPVSANSFVAWLRNLPLCDGRGTILQHNGKARPDQSSHVAVIDIDVGARDLQQCADAIIRLQAEYLWAVGRSDQIEFKFTSGDLARYSDWRRGMRPIVKGNKVEWRKTAEPDTSYKSFRSYLDIVFTYAGTRSLAGELEPVKSIGEIQSGDVLIDPGSPGHAVLVVDVLEHPETHERRFLLAQSFMPAQSVHVLKNPVAWDDPWYAASGAEIRTPDWTFKSEQLNRFRSVDAAKIETPVAQKRPNPTKRISTDKPPTRL